MPMKKNSTLIYWIKNYQKEIPPAIKQGDANSESSLAKAENGRMVPSEQTVNNILGFAQSYETMETEKNGHLEMILN